MQNTLLLDAVEAGDLSGAESLLERGCDVNKPVTKQGWTPLSLAASKGDLAMVQLLLRYGADVTATDQNHRTASQIAVAAGHVQVCKVLREAESAGKNTSVVRNTPLIEAVKAGDHLRVEELLEQGHDINQQGTEQEWPPLNFAAARGDTRMVRLLLRRKANVFGVGRDKRTPYQIALAAGHLSTCRLLHEAEELAGGDEQLLSSRAWERRPYCKAYQLNKLVRFPGWKQKYSSPSARDHDVESTQLQDD